MDRKPSKITQKDRYGNQITYEFAPEVKPIDPTALAKHAMDQGMEVPEIGIMEMGGNEGHPGQPQGSDTVPAWLTPGEFVVNAEAMRMPGVKEQVESINNQGRAIQQMQGGSIPSMGYQQGGQIPFIAGPRMNMPQYQAGGGDIDKIVDGRFYSSHVPVIKNEAEYGGNVMPMDPKHYDEPIKYLDDGGWITDQLLDKLAEVESGGNNDAVSPVGAIGKYQWLPKSAKQAGYGVEAFDPKDEKAARAATAKYLRNMQKHHGFTPEETLRAYNWGPGNVINYNKGKRKDIPDEALNYPRKILGVENTQGVRPPGDVPSPVARPGQDVELPTPRPQQEEGGLMSFLNKYVLGEKTKFNDGGQAGQLANPFPPGTYAYEQFEKNRPGEVQYTPPPVNLEVSPDAGSTSKGGGYGIADGIFDLLTAGALGFDNGGNVPNPNIVPEIKTGGHRMFGGNQKIDGSEYAAPPENYQPTLEDHGGEGQFVPSESWRKSYDPTHPEFVPLHGKNKTASDEKALEKAKQSLAETDVTAPEYDYKLNNIKNLEATVAASKIKDDQVKAGEANRKQIIDNTEIVAMEDKKALLEEKMKTVDEGTAEIIKGQIDEIDTKLNTTPNKDKGETKEEKKSQVLNKVLNKADTLDKNADGPGPDQAGANKSDAEVKKAAEQNPSKVDEAIGSLKSLFGDLFDTKELARMGVLYAGSRLLGYSHNGSLRYSAKQYLSRVDAKAANIASTKKELLKTGKYTPESIEAYAKSGVATDLIPAGSPITHTGNFKTFYKNGTRVRATEVKSGNNTYWLAPNGKKIDASFIDDASRVRGTKEYSERIKKDSTAYSSMVKELRSTFGTTKLKDKADVFGTELTPSVAGNKIAKWAAEENVPAEEMGSIVENAYHAALEHSKLSGEKVRDITPFLNQQYVISQVGNPDLFKDEKGNTVSGTNVSRLISSAQAAANQLGGKVSSTQILQGYRQAWTALSKEARDDWNSRAIKGENGFMKFVNADIIKSIK